MNFNICDIITYNILKQIALYIFAIIGLYYVLMRIYICGEKE